MIIDAGLDGSRLVMIRSTTIVDLEIEIELGPWERLPSNSFSWLMMVGFLKKLFFSVGTQPETVVLKSSSTASRAEGVVVVLVILLNLTSGILDLVPRN